MDQTSSNQTTPEQKIDPWTVIAPGGIDYDKLINQFGSQRITPQIIARFEKLTGKPAHPWLRRGIFPSIQILSYLFKAISFLIAIWKKFWIFLKLESLFISTLEEGQAAIHFILAIWFHSSLQSIFKTPLMCLLSWYVKNLETHFANHL